MSKTTWTIFSLSSLGIIGGLILLWTPVLGGLFILCGLGGLLWSLFSTEKRHNRLDKIQGLQAELLAKSGAGNVYYLAFEKDLLSTGQCENAVELLRKAISIDPNDYDSLSKLAGTLALQLLSRQGMTTESKSAQKVEIDEIKRLAKRATLLRPKACEPHTIMGIILDVEGDHKQARRVFKRAGDLGYSEWHFYISTSWGMEGNNVKALEEAKIGIKENPGCHWTGRFLYGRSLLHNGKYAAALIQLRLAYQIRGSRPELMNDLSTAYYFSGHMCYSAYLRMKASLSILTVYPKTAIYQFIQAFIHWLVGFHYILSKQVWRISRRNSFTQRLHMLLSLPYEPEATLSNMLWEQKHYNMALFHAKNAIQTCPHVAGLWSSLSSLHQILGHKESCLDSISHAINLDPDNPVWRYQREQILAAYEGRIEDIAPPTNIPIKYMRGVVFHEMDWPPSRKVFGEQSNT